MKGMLKFRDVGGIETIGFLKDLPNSVAITQMLGFATAVHSYTNAGVSEYGLISFQDFTPAATNPLVGSSVKNKGRCHFQYTSPNGETKLLTLWIPAPIMANFVNTPGVGYRMTDAAGNAIATALMSLTGITGLLFTVGILDYSEAGKGARNESCILYKDEVGNLCYMSVPQPVSLATMQAFETVISTYSMAAPLKGYYAEPNIVVVPTGDPLGDATTDDNGFDSVERRANLKFVYSEGTRRKWMTFGLPAPKTSIVEYNKNDDGYEVTEVNGTGVALAITSIYGSGVRAPRFRSGKVDHFELKNQ